MKNDEGKTRALIFSTAYFPFWGGAEVAIQEIAQRLPQYEWSLITARMDKKVPAKEQVGALTVYRVGFGWGALDKFLLFPFGLWKASQLHRKKPFQIAWSMMASQASVAAAFFKHRFPGVRLVLTLQEGDEEEYLARYVGGNQFLYKLLIYPWYRLVFRGADYTTAISTYLKDRAVLNGVESPIEIIPNGVDLTRFVPTGVAKEAAHTVLVTNSRMVEKNAMRYVIEALPLLPPQVHFWIIGGGPLERDLRALVASLGLEDRVLFLGYREHPEMIELMQKAHIFIRPSLSEGLGISFLEAMALELPIIGTPVGGIPDFLHDKQTGFMVPPKDPAAIAKVVTEIVANPMLAEKVAKQGRELIQSGYDWNSIAVRMSEKAFNYSLQFPPVLVAAGIYPPDPGGPALHAEQQVKLYTERGMRVRVVALSHYRHLPPGVRHAAYLFALLSQSVPGQVVFGHDAQGVGVPALIAAKLSLSPLILRIGGDVVWERAAESGETTEPLSTFYEKGLHKNNRRFFVSRFVLRRAKQIIVTTELLSKAYIRYYGIAEGQIDAVSNPIPPRSEIAVQEHDGTLFFASRLVAYKNVDLVIDAFLEVHKKNPEARLLLAGSGPLREELIHRAARLGVGDVVSLPGTLSQEEVARRTETCTAGISLAQTEFNPNHILRVLSLGKPFLISRENGLPFAVPEQFLVDPQNKEEMILKMNALYDAEKYRAASVAVRSITFTMSWNDVVDRHLEILKKACAY